MTNKEFFLQTLKDEMPIFIRVFKAVEATPKKGHTTFKHDEKSRTAFDLIEQSFGVEALALPGILKKGTVDFGILMKRPGKFKSIADVRKLFEKNMKEVAQTIKKMKDADWETSKAAMVEGKKEMWVSTKGGMVWSFLLDLIHHRGQLSTYIRPMGGKVPSIYGPSADTK